MLRVYLFLIVISVTATCFGFGNFEDVYVTFENYHEFCGAIPDYIYDIFIIAEAAPKILQPCNSTIWMMGDSAIITWQGASLAYARRFHRTDSVEYHCNTPIWYCKIELYQNGEFIYNILPSMPGTILPPVDLNSLNNHWYSQHELRFPRVDVSDRLDRYLSGSGCQIRIISSSRSSELDEYVEMWSDPFVIVDPWLDILTPDSSTVWREDSSDVHIDFESHGSFGYNGDPFSAISTVYLIRNGEQVDRISSYFICNISDVELSFSDNVKQRWGNGDGFRIYIELRNGMKFYSDIFSIYGQTIDISLRSIWYTRYHGNFQFEWTPSSGETITIELYELSQDGLVFVEVLASDIRNEGYFISEAPPSINWVGSLFRIKLVDSDGNYGWSDNIFFNNEYASFLWFQNYPLI